jgi:hypothetical protein
VTTSAGQEPAPGTPAALALLASRGIAPRAATGLAVCADDQRFSPVTIGHLTHRLVEVKLLLDQLNAEQKELHETPHCQESCPPGLTRPPGGPTDDHATAL